MDLDISNSNGKKIIELLIKAAVYNAEICIVPEVIKCRQYFYRIHISTHTTRQPAQVLRNKGKTLDAFVTLVTTKSPPQDIESYLTTFYQFVPPVLVANADTTLVSGPAPSLREEGSGETAILFVT